MRCTFCGKEINDIKTKVELKVSSERLRKDEVWEPIPNMRTFSKETLCAKCFAKFISVLNTEMTKKVGNKIV